MNGPTSELRTHDRRAFLQVVYGATLGALVAACGSNDAEVFAAENAVGSEVSAGSGGTASVQEEAPSRTLRVQTDESATTVAGSTSSEPMDSTASVSTTAGDTTSTTSSTSSTGVETSASSSTTSSSSTTGGSAGALPAGGTMVVSFTYEQQSGGKNVPPYVAVWIEDGSGDLLTTVALWYQQFGRGERWLPDLTRWYNVDQNRIASGGVDSVDAISGPTRSPGSYQVAWDGRVNGSVAPAGSYFVCIESARERGPYSLIRQSVNLDGAGKQQTLSGDGELANASMAVNG